MQEQDFPALYRSADELSFASQTRFLNAFKFHLILLVFTAILSVAGNPHWSIAVLQLLSLLGVLSCSVYLFTARPDKLWYAGRAVAESIKTITWRYVCRAEPFQGDDALAKSAFHQTLKQIVEQNKAICQKFTRYLDEPQITGVMDEMRLCALDERKEFYASGRIKDQLTWYAKKTVLNSRASKLFFFILIAVNSLAVILAALRIVFIELPFWPTDVFVAIAASLLSWMQAKRFSELAASYALAAHEIGLIREQSMIANTDESFSIFVGDAENAFSREHTQWVARKDI